MQRGTRPQLLSLAVLLAAPALMHGQYVQTQSEIWLDTWPGQAAGITATVADYNTYYWYDLSVWGFLYENGAYRGYCWANTSGYYSASCAVMSPLNPGSEYVNHGYHDVTATYYAPGPVNVPYGSYCYYYSCWWDYYGFSLLSVDPYYYPSYGNYFAPGTQISVSSTTTKSFQSESRKRAPGSAGREYYLTHKSFIPYDNALSGNPLDQCYYWEGGTNVGSMVFYSGDYRQWTYWGTYRTIQSQWASPSQARNPAGYRNAVNDAGMSNSYAMSGMVANSSSPTGFWIDYNSIPEWDPLWDCRMRHGRDKGSINGPGNYATRINNQSITSYFSGEAANPIAPLSYLGPIRWTINTQLTENVGNPTMLNYTITGFHTCFPAHEVWADNNQLYSRFPTSVSQAAPCLLGIYPMTPIATSGTKVYF